MSSVVQFQKKEGIASLTLDRPEKRNALNPELINALRSAFRDIESDPSLKAVVLSGAGKSFCSGADLHWLKDDKLFSKKEVASLFSLYKAVKDCPIPVIALAHHFVVGGGLGLLSACDIAIVEKDTQFRFSETHLGLVPSVISPFVLRKISLSWASFFMLTAMPFSAKKALEISLVHFVGSQSECNEFLKKILKQFDLLDQKAVSKTKKLLNTIYLSPVEKVKTQCVKIIHEARKEAETKKRIQSLLGSMSNQKEE